MIRRPIGSRLLLVVIFALALWLTLTLTGCSLSNGQLRVAYHATNAADAYTTLERDPRCMVEGNPVLGSDPSDGKVIGFVLLQSLLYEAICSGPAREQGEEKACRIAFLGLKGLTVAWNTSQLAKGCH